MADNLPCADLALLGPLFASADFAAIGDRVRDRQPTDTWQENELHFFVFDLESEGSDRAADQDGPVAVFAMHPGMGWPVSAVVITPQAGGQAAEIQDLKSSDARYLAAI